MKKRKKRIRSVLLITVIPLMLIAMAYIIVSIYYMDRFFQIKRSVKLKRHWKRLTITIHLR